MKVLYIVHQFYPEFASGTEKFLFNLCSSLQKDGHSVHVVTYSFQEQGTRRQGELLAREYSYKHIPVTAVRHVKIPIDIHTAWGGPEICQFAEGFLRRFEPDVLHVAHPMRLGAFARAANTLGVPYVITLTDFWMMCPKINLQTSSGNLCAGPDGGNACARFCPELDHGTTERRLQSAKVMLNGAEAVTAPSQFVASMFRNEFEGIKVRVIPHGIDQRRLRQKKKRYRPGDKIVFAYAGGLAPHKGVHILLQAFRQLEKANAELRIHGTHFEQADYYELLQRLGGTDTRICFCGPYSEERVGDILQSVDVLVVPSLVYETYSLITHEALVCGVPVIASRAGALAEAIVDSVNGFTVGVGNEHELIETLRRVVASPEILNEITAQVRDYAPPLIEEEAYLYQRIYTGAEEHQVD